MNLEETVKDLLKRVEKLEKKQSTRLWLTMEQFKEYTGLTNVKYIYGLNAKRTFRTRRVGGLQFYKPSVDEWLKKQERSSMEELKREAANIKFK